MKKMLIKTFCFVIWTGFLFSCSGNSTGNETHADTIDKIPVDTTIGKTLPGTPGASGTAPGPNDTTQAHRDSLKMLKNISDSASHAGAK